VEVIGGEEGEVRWRSGIGEEVEGSRNAEGREDDMTKERTRRGECLLPSRQSYCCCNLNLEPKYD